MCKFGGETRCSALSGWMDGTSQDVWFELCNGGKGAWDVASGTVARIITHAWRMRRRTRSWRTLRSGLKERRTNRGVVIRCVCMLFVWKGVELIEGGSGSKRWVLVIIGWVRDEYLIGDANLVMASCLKEKKHDSFPSVIYYFDSVILFYSLYSF